MNVTFIYIAVSFLLFSVQLKQVIDSDAAMTDDLVAYNIVPLDAPTVANAIVSFPEVSQFPK